MWLITAPVFLALVPYFIYSIFHVATYFSEYVLPAITSRPAKPQEDRLAQLARTYQDMGSQTVAKVEVYGILIRLLFGILSYLPLSHVCMLMRCSFSKFAFVQLPVFAIFLRYKYFNAAYTKNHLRELSAGIDRLVTPLPPVVQDTWIKIRNGIAYYGARPLVAGEGAPGATGPGVTRPHGGATGAQRATSGTTQPRM
jgi:transmembrane protein 33